MMTNIALSLEACTQLNIPYEMLHSEESLYRIKLNNKVYYFANDTTPVNSQAIAYLLKDREYIYYVFKNKLKVPKTLAFLSPLISKDTLKRYLDYPTIEQMIEMVKLNFTMPVILSKNTGADRKNVFLCQEIAEVENAVRQIFNDRNYDSVALVREYVEIEKQYSAIALYNELVLLYEKGINQPKLGDKVISGEAENAVGKQITNPDILAAIGKFIQPIFQEIAEAKYFRCNIAVDKSGQYWLMSMTSKPNYRFFLKHNDAQIAVEIFKKLIQGLPDC